jgi:NADH-quinone oxidoreductase subunit D
VSSTENPSLSDYRRREQSITLSQLEDSLDVPGAETSQELLTLNFGPHHPATHGVLRLLVTLQAEIVRDIKPVIGYVHTGIEKTAEDKSYWKVIPVIERMDTSPTTSTRWPSAARWRSWSRSRSPGARSTCA